MIPAFKIGRKKGPEGPESYKYHERYSLKRPRPQGFIAQNW